MLPSPSTLPRMIEDVLHDPAIVRLAPDPHRPATRPGSSTLRGPSTPAVPPAPLLCPPMAPLQEYQGKPPPARAGPPVPRGGPASSPDHAADIARSLAGTCVIKIQAWTTGR